MPALDYRARRRHVSLAQVLELLDFVPVARCGAHVRGPGPVHGSRTPRRRSFAAHLERHRWHCCGCGAGGNAPDWWVAVTQRPLYEAALDLCQRLLLDGPRLPAGRRRLTRSPPGD